MGVLDGGGSTVVAVDNRAVDPSRAVWVTTPRFSAGDDVQPGLLHAWERDAEDAIWRARVWCLRETAPGFPGPDFRGTVPATRVEPRDRDESWCQRIDGVGVDGPVGPVGPVPA